jgi:hypothetical protein
MVKINKVTSNIKVIIGLSVFINLSNGEIKILEFF